MVMQASTRVFTAAADLSNIELRMCHYLCDETATMDALRQGQDLYCNFATTFYGRTITKTDKKERQHGKVAMLQLQFQSGAESFRKAARIMAGESLASFGLTPNFFKPSMSRQTQIAFTLR